MGNKDPKIPLVTPKVSVDLVKESLLLLRLLDQVEQHPVLCHPKIVKLAVARYEKFWLPFLSSYDNSKRWLIGPKKVLVPPLDIAWVWLVHLLAPQYYCKDYKAVTGHEAVGHSRPHHKSEKAVKRTAKMWQKLFPKEPFEINLAGPKSTAGDFQSKIGYDLADAVNRQWAFIYQVNLPHFRKPTFLNAARSRYTKMLQLKLINPDRMLVPTYDIEILWQAHMACCSEYQRDTQRLLKDTTLLDIDGCVPHFDFVIDRNPDPKVDSSFQETSALWYKTFNGTMHLEGAMWRGHAPQQTAVDNSMSIQTSRWDVEPPSHLQPCERIHKTGKVVQLRLIASEQSRPRDSYFTIFLEHMGPASGFAGVRVTDQDGRAAADAHMIGCEQLPFSDREFYDRDYPAFSSYKTFLKTRDPERAFLITTQGRDWGILMCKWSGFKPRNEFGRVEAGYLEPRLFLKTSGKWVLADLSVLNTMLKYRMSSYNRSFKLDINMNQSSFALSQNVPGWQKDVAPCIALMCCISLAAIMLEGGRGHRCQMFIEDKGLYGVAGVQPIQVANIMTPGFLPSWLMAHKGKKGLFKDGWIKAKYGKTEDIKIQATATASTVDITSPVHIHPDKEEEQQAHIDAAEQKDDKVTKSASQLQDGSASDEDDGNDETNNCREIVVRTGPAGPEDALVWMPYWNTWDMTYFGTALSCVGDNFVPPARINSYISVPGQPGDDETEELVLD